MQETALKLEIPVKNIRRWLQSGIHRKKGGGRKVQDEQMQQRLYEWCFEKSLEQSKPVTRLQLRQKALQLSNYPKVFKASKGWLDQFAKKHNLRENVIGYLQSHGVYMQYKKDKHLQTHKRIRKHTDRFQIIL